MMDLISKIANKPTDKNIRITRIVFASILLAIIALGWPVTRTEFGLPEGIKYALFIFPAVGLIRGIFDPGIFRKKIWKWTIFGFGVTMVLITLFVIEDQPLITELPTTTTSTGSISASEIINTTSSSIPFTLSTDNFFGFFGFILIIVGLFLNNKNITKKNERHAEIVKKIRV